MKKKLIGFAILLGWCATTFGQNLHYFFIEDAYQRCYFNPALNDEYGFRFTTGLGLDFATTGPNVSDLTTRDAAGNLILSAESVLSEMKEVNDVFGYASVNTFDASFNTPWMRISVGHAWKTQAWMEYTKDLAEFVTLGNGPFVGETMQLGPQIDYLNYNEVYLGLQKSFGKLSIGVRAKRLSGIETIVTENSQIDLTTSDDVYQLTLENDFELNSSRAFDYEDIENFDVNVSSFSFDNFFQNNGGWAFDLGASYNVNEKLELSLGIIDLGGISWNVDPSNYTTVGTQNFAGIDVSEFINSDDEFVVLDSIETLLDLQETNNEFTTRLPTKIYLGGRLKLNDVWTVGGLVQTNGSGDRSINALALNATAQIFDFLSVGALYSYKTGNPANVGLHTTFQAGPFIGFLSTDNVLGFRALNTKNTNIRLGLGVNI